MHRNMNHHFNNGDARRRLEPPFLRTSLKRHIAEKWLNCLIGIVGFLAGVFIIIQNEARAVVFSRLLDDSLSLVTSILPDAEVDEANIGKLVYLTGTMTIHEPLTEVDYGISVLAVKLFRNVQMYQWVETESDFTDADGNVVTTSYYYHTDWQNNLIDSSLFETSMGHWNPKEFPIKKQTQINENVKVGKYYLGLELKKKFTDFVHVTGDERPERPDIKLHSGLYYHCQDLWKPEVGDVRIQFSYAGQHGQVVTVIARLDQNLTLVPFTFEHINILMLRPGQFSLENMFALAHSQNKFVTWMYRGVGWFLLYLSCIILTTFLQIIVSSSSLLQEILPVSHSSLNMTVSMCTSVMVTALAWVWYSPFLGFGLIVATALLPLITKWFLGELPPLQYNRL